MSSPKRLANPGKFEAVRRSFDRIRALKNTMGAYAQAHVTELWADAYAFKRHYRDFISTDLNAWERQSLFSDIVDAYVVSIRARFQNTGFFVQTGWTATRYQRNVWKRAEDGTRFLAHPKGSLKSFDLSRKTTPLTRMAQFLLYCRLDSLNVEAVSNPELRGMLQYCRDEKPAVWERLLRLVSTRQSRLLGRTQRIRYTTGSHRRSPAESRSRIFLDTTNTEYTRWYAYRLGTGKDAEIVHLPLLYNEKRQPWDALRLDAIQSCTMVSGRRFQVGATFEAPALEFQESREFVGIDVNTKHNLMSLSDGKVVSYDAARLSSLLALLDKLQRKPGGMTFRDKARVAKLLRANAASIQRSIRELLNALESEGVTDLAVEDIDMRGDATFIRHPLLGVKYSRLLRLLRLGNVKHWLFAQAEKRGIRVHHTNPAYTSQECPRCHHISRENRLTQEEFRCTECGHAGNADFVASQNIRNRVLADVPRGRNACIHHFDGFGRATPKPLSYKLVPDVLGNGYYGVSPGHSPEPLGPGLPNKCVAGMSPVPIKEADAIAVPA